MMPNDVVPIKILVNQFFVTQLDKIPKDINIDDTYVVDCYTLVA